MYKEYFGLRETPFSIAPDPRYLYMSEGHREALAHLEYGLRGDGGFVLLTGEVGTGKTTVCRCLLEQIPDYLDVAFILNPRVTAEELLATVCDELGIVYPDGNTSVKVFVDRINEFLIETHATGHKTVVIIEEAQNLRFDVLEQLRLLTNLETNERKLLQIIMVGQPELRDMLRKPELSQLSQRITARYHLGPLSGEEVVQYVSHRLSVAGGPGGLFPAPAMKRLSRLTGGIPRLINVLCDRALLGTYVQGKERVDKATLKRAAQEVFGETGWTAALGNKYEKIFAGVMIIILGIALSAYYYFRTGRTGDTAGVPSQVHITGKVSERPRLDTLWWFDRWSVLRQGPEEGASAMRYEDRWAVQGQVRTQSPANEQKHSDAAVGQAPDAAVRNRGE